MVWVRMAGGEGNGSGFVVARNESGPLLVTNAHVVHEATSIQLVVNNQDNVPARALSVDTEHDLALLQADGSANPAWSESVPALELVGEDETVSEGTEIAAVGYPMADLFKEHDMGVVASVTRGIVSASRPSDHGPLYQTDVSLNPGNSGGPVLMWDDSRVAGVAVAKLNNAQGVTFVIPSATVRAFLNTQHLLEEPTPTPAPARKKRRSAPPAAEPPWGLLAAGALALGLALLLAFALSRRSSGDRDEPTSPL